MLEIVGINLSGLKSLIRHDIIGEFDDFKCDSLFCEVVDNEIEKCSMWLRACSDSENRGISGFRSSTCEDKCTGNDSNSKNS